jgi:ribosomal protein S18 acetylase RimI-like enzyme
MIQPILSRDRAWALYALGDLSPRHFPQTTWYINNQNLVLIYRGADPPILFAMGEPEALRIILADVREPALSLSVCENVLPILLEFYKVSSLVPMRRMLAHIEPVVEPLPNLPMRRLSSGDEPAVRALFQDGALAGEAPDFFLPWMLSEGVFFGLWNQGQLIAVAGTHLVSAEEQVAAVGNIYTRRDQRGRGYGTAVTIAVTHALRNMGMTTIGLNVKRENAAALRAYQKAGYRFFCDFLEGIITRTDG